jgi:hypothetical protein
MSGLKKEIQALEKELKTVQKEADKLNQKEKKVTETFSAERDIDNQVDKRFSHSDDIDKREAEALAQIKAQQEELNQKTQEYNAMLEQANAKLQQQQAIAQASKDLDSAVKSEAILDKISTQEEYNSLLEQTQAKMAAIEDRARQIAEANNVSYEALLASNPTYQKLSDTMGVLTSTTREFKSEAESAGNSAKKSFKNAKKEANGLDGSIKKGIKTLSRMALAVFGIRGAYSLVRRAVSACLEGNEELNKKMTAIWNTLGTIMEPVVTAMMSAIYKILAYINYFVKAITGIDFVANANAKAIAKQAKATDKLTKSTKEANKALASFDEMNVLQDKSSSGSAIDAAATLDLPELTEEERATIDGIVEVFNNVRDAIEEVKIKCSELNEWWNTLDETTQNLIITLGIAGLVGILIGSISVASAFLAVIGTIEAFNLLLTGDTTDAVDAFIILLGVAGLVGILIGGTTGWTVAGAIMAVAMILTGLVLLVEGDTTDAILGFIALLGGSGLIGYLLTGVKGMSVGIAIASVVTILNGFNDLLSGDTETAIKGVIKILTGSAGLIFAFKATKAIVTGSTGLQAVLTGLQSPLLIVALGVAVLLAGVVELSKNWGKLDGGQKAITILASLAAAAIAAAVAFAAFHTAWSAGAAAIAIAAGLAVLGVSLGGISSAFAKNAVGDSVTATAKSFADSTDFTTNPMPKLAVGGIVNRPGRGVPAIIGEAGAEAVLPLENNTEWMDILAEKIGGNVTIPIYMDGKKIATYVVDIQKKKAFAMNGV